MGRQLGMSSVSWYHSTDAPLAAFGVLRGEGGGGLKDQLFGDPTEL